MLSAAQPPPSPTRGYLYLKTPFAGAAVGMEQGGGSAATTKAAATQIPQSEQRQNLGLKGRAKTGGKARVCE